MIELLHTDCMDYMATLPDMGFDLVGCELDADYYKAASKRLANHQLQQKLF